MPSWPNLIFGTVFGLLALLAARLAYLAIIGRRMDDRPRCPKCWYDMTGAPSLTCPECGHDARSVARLTKNRRSVRRLMDTVALALLLWYSLQVRYRITRIGELPLTAMTPTTYFIARSAMANVPADVQETVRGRLFHHNAAVPQVMDWQVWLESWAAFQNLKGKPAAGLRDPRMELMHRLTFHSESAKRYWAKLAVVSPQNVTDEMVKDIFSRRSQHLQTMEMRLALWDLFQQQRVATRVFQYAEWMHKPDAIAAVSDKQLLIESAAAVRNELPDDMQRRYLSQLVARKPPGALAVVEAAPEGGSLYRKLVLRSAWCRLQDLPGPITMTTTPHSDLPDFFYVEVKLTDPQWQELLLDALRTPSGEGRSMMYLQVIATTEVGGTAQDSVWRTIMIEQDLLRRGDPWRFLVYTGNAPKPSRMRVTMLSRLEGAIEKPGKLRLPDLMPISNEIRVPEDLHH